ncbi:MAG: hypothetical protein U0575_06695 [Phycisphaerales bacterium]
MTQRTRRDVSTIVLKALAKDPARRYQTAAALRDDIDHYLAGKPIDARRDSTWYVIRKTAGRHKPLLAGSVLVALAIVAGAGVAGYGLLRAREARGYETVERVRAQGEARAARSAGRFIQQMFMPGDAGLDDAALGRYVRASTIRILSSLRLGALSDDLDAEAAARSVFASEMTRDLRASAEVLIRMSIASQCRQHGDNHPQLAEAFHELAESLHQRGGRQIEAERFVRRAIEMRRELFRDGDPALAASEHLLARILLARGDAAGAATACEEAVGALRVTGTPSKPELAAALATRSDIRRTLGQAAGAEADALESLVLGLEALIDDDDHFVIACLLRNADLLRAEGDRPADPVLAAALRASTRADVAAALALAADGLRRRGTTAADCLAYTAGLETILSLRASFFGSDHPSVVRTAAWIAANQLSALDFAAAEASLLRLIPLLEARLGRESIVIIPTRELLFECLMMRENHERAAAVRRHMIEVWNAQPALARDDLWIANEHRWLALALALGGAFSEAEAEYRECIDGLARAGLPDHYLGDICTGALGWIALHLGRPEEAESLTRAALDRYSARTGVPADQLLLLQRHRAHVLIARGALDEAAPLIDAAVAALTTPVGYDVSLISCTLLDAIELARLKGDQATVERLSSELAEARRRVGVFPGG